MKYDKMLSNIFMYCVKMPNHFQFGSGLILSVNHTEVIHYVSGEQETLLTYLHNLLFLLYTLSFNLCFILTDVTTTVE